MRMFVHIMVACALSGAMATPSPAQVCESYRLVQKTICEPQQVTTYRLQYETIMEEQTVTVQKPVWETEMRENRYRVAKPVVETAEREEGDLRARFEFYQHIHVAVGTEIVPQGGAEKRKLGNAPMLTKSGYFLAWNSELLPLHGLNYSTLQLTPPF